MGGKFQYSVKPTFQLTLEEKISLAEREEEKAVGESAAGGQARMTEVTGGALTRSQHRLTPGAGPDDSEITDVGDTKGEQRIIVVKKPSILTRKRKAELMANSDGDYDPDVSINVAH